MALFNDEYNKLARTIAKVSITLDRYDKLRGVLQTLPIHIIAEAMQIYAKEFLHLAYICQVGIIDRVERNNWDLSKPIAIPTGVFSSTMMTLEEALEITILKLSEIVSEFNSIELEDKMTEIFQKGELFYEIEEEIPNEMLKLMK